jgi:hypothetical protein
VLTLTQLNLNATLSTPSPGRGFIGSHGEKMMAHPDLLEKIKESFPTTPTKQ